MKRPCPLGPPTSVRITQAIVAVVLGTVAMATFPDLLIAIPLGVLALGILTMSIVGWCPLSACMSRSPQAAEAEPFSYEDARDVVNLLSPASAGPQRREP